MRNPYYCHLYPLSSWFNINLYYWAGFRLDILHDAFLIFLYASSLISFNYVLLQSLHHNRIFFFDISVIQTVLFPFFVRLLCVCKHTENLKKQNKLKMTKNNVFKKIMNNLSTNTEKTDKKWGKPSSRSRNYQKRKFC